MSADWTTARVVRDRDGKHALRIDDLPVIRTVGDLTERKQS